MAEWTCLPLCCRCQPIGAAFPAPLNAPSLLTDESEISDVQFFQGFRDSRDVGWSGREKLLRDYEVVVPFKTSEQELYSLFNTFVFAVVPTQNAVDFLAGELTLVLR